MSYGNDEFDEEDFDKWAEEHLWEFPDGTLWYVDLNYGEFTPLDVYFARQERKMLLELGLDPDAQELDTL